MAEQNFTLKDIKNFLKEQFNFHWFYDVYDYDLILFRKAKLEDFNNSKSVKISVMKNMDKQKEINFKTAKFLEYWIIVSNDRLIITGYGDYSQQWQELLASKENGQTV